jgi:hypothetical protein
MRVERILRRFTFVWGYDGRASGAAVEREDVIVDDDGTRRGTGERPAEALPTEGAVLAAISAAIDTAALLALQAAHAERDTAVAAARDLAGKVANFYSDQQAVQSAQAETVQRLGTRLAEAEEAVQRERDLAAGLRARVAQLEGEAARSRSESAHAAAEGR